MLYKDYKKLKVGDKIVVISTGEPGKVTAICRKYGGIKIMAAMHGFGIVNKWFEYTELERI